MSVSRETERLEAYLRLLHQWSAVINLTSERDEAPEHLREHIETSLSVVPHLPPGLDFLIDLGSGQGFPAIPIAIRTGVPIHLIEAHRRKAAFLTTVMARLGLAGTVWPTRIEQAAVPKSACVTARALAPLAKLLPLARPHLREGGCCLFLKGAEADDEIRVAQSGVSFAVEKLPTANPPSCLVKITGLR